MNALRQFLYAFARLLGDVNAIHRGPRAVVHRMVRKRAHKLLARILR